MSKVVFWLSFLIITLFAVVDTYINIKYPITWEVEEFSFTQLILFSMNNDLALFVAIKLFCTVLAAAFLLVLYFNNQRIAAMSAGGAAFVLMAILSYMLYA